MPSTKSAEDMARQADSLIKDFLRTSATEENIALAEKALVQARGIEKSPLALMVQARICRAKGEHEGALDACDEALGRDSTLTELSMQKAFALVFLGRPKEALVTAMDLDLRDAEPGNFYWLLGRAYFTLASASTTRRKDEKKYYHNAIHWLKKCVKESPDRWYVRAHLIGAYALAEQLEEDEANAAITEYGQKFKDWPLKAIKEWARHQRFKGDAHHDFRVAIKALLKGLEEAKAKNKNFP